jgi:GT2 family glycosyltransferase
MSRVPCTAIVTAHERVDMTLTTLKRIQGCEPRPDETIVHIDGNQTQCEAAIRNTFPDVRVLRSETGVGPGGGRNKLIAAAKNEIVASFDDDSFPIDADYFQRLQNVFNQFPAASIVCAAVHHRGERASADVRVAEWVADFVGCGCGYRRDTFLKTSGYVPLRLAYGMEEVDLALRLHAQGNKILRTPWLRIFHDTDRKHHADSSVTAASIANLALLTYLRYPPSFWLAGVGQCLNRVLWLLRHGRWRGSLSGIVSIPGICLAQRSYRQKISAAALKSFLHLRRAPVFAGSIQ